VNAVYYHDVLETDWIRTSAFRIAGVGHRMRILFEVRQTTFNRDAHVRVLPPLAESLGELLFWNAKVRILPPQPVSNAY
jgi:hypothetical protein